jgi:hypothetical protein
VQYIPTQRRESPEREINKPVWPKNGEDERNAAITNA